MEKYRKEFDINLRKNNLCNSFDINIKKSASQTHNNNKAIPYQSIHIKRNKKQLLTNHIINFIPLPKGIINKKNVDYIHFDKNTMNSTIKTNIIPLDKSPSHKYFTTLSSSGQFNQKSTQQMHLSSASTIQSTDDHRIAISQLKNNLNTKEALIRELNIRLSSHENTIKELLGQVRNLKEIISKSNEEHSNMNKAFNKELAILKEQNEIYKQNEGKFAEAMIKIKETGIDINRILLSVFKRKETEEEEINSESLVSIYFPDKIIKKENSVTEGNYSHLRKDLIPKLNFDRVLKYQSEQSDHDKDYVNYTLNGLDINKDNSYENGYYYKNSHQYNNSTANIKMKPKVLFLDFPENKIKIANPPYQKHKYATKKYSVNK